MDEFICYYDDIPYSVEVVNYSPYKNNRIGHIDNWLPDEPEDIEIRIFNMNNEDVTDSVSEYTVELFTKQVLKEIKNANYY